MTIEISPGPRGFMRGSLNLGGIDDSRVFYSNGGKFEIVVDLEGVELRVIADFDVQSVTVEAKIRKRLRPAYSAELALAEFDGRRAA